MAELDNAAVAERLEAFAGLLDLAGASGYSARAYRRAAQTIYYSLASDEIRALIETLNRLYRPNAGEAPVRSARLGAAA